jgi:hypothetical protein
LFPGFDSDRERKIYQDIKAKCSQVFNKPTSSPEPLRAWEKKASSTRCDLGAKHSGRPTLRREHVDIVGATCSRLLWESTRKVSELGIPPSKLQLTEKDLRLKPFKLVHVNVLLNRDMHPHEAACKAIHLAKINVPFFRNRSFGGISFAPINIWRVTLTQKHMYIIKRSVRYFHLILTKILVYFCILALQPFVGPWLHFQFLNPIHSGMTPWMGHQPVARPLPKQNNTNTE